MTQTRTITVVVVVVYIVIDIIICWYRLPSFVLPLFVCAYGSVPIFVAYRWCSKLDGRIAVNAGGVVLVYQPRFEGKQRYGFTAYSIQCPDADATLLDLQRYPGEVRRVGFPQMAKGEGGWDGGV